MEGEIGNRLHSLILVWMLAIPALAGLIVLSDNASAVVRYVGPDSTYKNLQDALDNATSGDIIVLDEGTYNGSFRSTKDNIMIRGNSSINTTLVLDGNDPAILRGNSLDLTGLTIENGTLRITGNNADVSEIILDSTIELVNSTGSNFEGIEMGNSVEKGIHFRNCTSSKVDGLRGINITGPLVILKDCNDSDLEWITLTLKGSDPGISIENSDGTTLDRFDLTSNGNGIHGISIADSDNVRISNGSMDISGKGITISSADQVVIYNSTFLVTDNSSVGLDIDLTSNLLMDLIDMLTADRSTGIRISDSNRVSLQNSSLEISGEGIGLMASSSRSLEIENGSVNSEGEGSTGIHFREISNTNIHGMDLLSRGMISISILLENSTNMNISGGSINSMGDESGGIIQRGASSELLFEKARFNVRGREATGLHLENATDCVCRGNQFKVEGVSAVGLMASGSNLSLSDNSYTALEQDGVGAVLSGRDINSLNDSAYSMGRASLGLSINHLDDFHMSGANLDLTGIDSRGMEITGASGSYHFFDCDIEGDDDSGSLVDVDDTLSSIDLNECSLVSENTGTVFRGRIHSANIINSTIKGPGEGVHFLDSPIVTISNTDFNSSLPVRIFNGNATIVDSNLGDGSQSIEVFDNTRVIMMNTPFHGVLVDPTSEIEAWYSIMVKTVDRFDDPLSNVDLRIISGGGTEYETGHFNSSSADPRTDPDGMAGPLLLKDVVFKGSPDPIFVNNTIDIFKKGSSSEDWNESYDLNTSARQTLTFVSPDVDRPAVVTNLTVTPLDTREELRVSWTPNTDDTVLYKVFRLDMNDLSTWHLEAEVDHPMATWTTQGFSPGEVGIFRITAFDGTWESAPSKLATGVAKDLTPPVIPEDLTLLFAGERIITISWEHPGSDDLNGFDLFLNKTDSLEMEKVDSVEAENRSYTFTGLYWGTTYRIQVRAVDLSGNPSNLTPVLTAMTAVKQVSVLVEAYYDDNGPLAGKPVFNGTVSLFSFNGSIAASGITDTMGRILFTGLNLDEYYTVRIAPPEDHLGERDVRSGYLVLLSDTFSMGEEDPEGFENFTLAYYEMPVIGSVKISVSYGEGPRDGPAYQAYVVLLKDSGEVVEAGQTDADGERDFTIPRIPFRGRFEITPAQGIAGDEDANKSGYLPQTTNFFEVTASKPDFGLFEVELVYFDFTAPPDDLMIASFMPKGLNVSLDADIVIRFSMPVNKNSVEANVKVVPGLSGIRYVWDSSGRNLTIKHDSFLPEKEYTVTVEFGAISVEGTNFPDDYSDNSWTFTTEEEDTGGGGSGGISDQVLWIVSIGILVVVIIVGLYLFSTRRRMDGELDEDDVYALSDEEYYDEEEEYFDEGEDEYLDSEFDDFPEDEEMMGFEEGEEYPEEETGDELPPEDEEPSVEDEEASVEEPAEEEIAPPEEEPREEGPPEEEEAPREPDEEEMMEEDEEKEVPKKKPRKKKGKKRRK
jgi:uncharacterized protein YjbI with pentapeptide repeats